MQVKKLEDSSSKRSICNTNMSLWRSIFHRHFITFNNFQVLAYSSASLNCHEPKKMGWVYQNGQKWARVPDLAGMLQGCPCKLQPQPYALPTLCAERAVRKRSLHIMHQLSPQLNMPDWLLQSSPSKKKRVDIRRQAPGICSRKGSVLLPALLFALGWLQQLMQSSHFSFLTLGTT